MDRAKALFGGRDWIDLSTGINRVPYPIPPLPPEAWTALPTPRAMGAAARAAERAWGSARPLIPVAGAQAAIQVLPRLWAPGLARILAPTYNEHAAQFRAAGWRVEEVVTLSALNGADLAVVVNPNNPDGQAHDPTALLALDVRRLIVDESFADPVPHLSLLPHMREGLVVLRSFGKFYGLAGLRLGFVAGADVAPLAGPWPIAGVALEVGRAALDDTDWAAVTIDRLARDAARMDALAPWPLVGGTHLFRTYATADAAAAQAHLARHGIWSRIFPYSRTWLRLGLPAPHEWDRVKAALPRE
nr:aminotransferase class I/II-fold pyridoxal phosphate-dependent enzyme [Falsirhodobacter halotolerans]